MLKSIKHMVLLIVAIVFVTAVGNQKIAFAKSYIDELEQHWIQPVHGGKITDTFGTRNGNHKGVDIAAPEGTEIISVSDGVVSKSYYSDSYGHVVFVQHPEGYETVYAHLSKRLVKEGETINKGQLLGIIGNTGVSRGTHLNFELHKGEWTVEKNNALDPLFVFELPSNSVSANKNIENPTSEEQDVKHKAMKTEMNNSIVGRSSIKQEKKDTESNKQVVTIKKGDTLWEFSQKYKVSVQAIQEWNQLQSDLIYEGDKLVVYVNKMETYVVQKGDTLQSIANEYKTDANSIKKNNQLINETIYPNQVLVINPNT